MDETSRFCPSCNHLVHSERLKELFREVSEYKRTRRFSSALESWQKFIELVPEGSKQYVQAVEDIKLIEGIVFEEKEIARKAADRENDDRGAANIAMRIAGTLVLLSLFFGPHVGFGLFVLIYIHEYGHIFAMKHFGIECTRPVFVPLHGAYVRLKSMPENLWQYSMISLGGPFAGILASLAVFYVAENLLAGSAQSGILGKTAYYGFVVSLINLLPFGDLDGRGITRGFSIHHWLPIAIVAWKCRVGGSEGLMTLFFVFIVLNALFSLVGTTAPPDSPVSDSIPSMLSGFHSWTLCSLYVLMIVILNGLLNETAVFVK